ncbi:MAG TPA: hypothetical protein VFT98_13975 [Myxococcota bacterium]|nr:hypothetical protein [Myxococcota bacterium]
MRHPNHTRLSASLASLLLALGLGLPGCEERDEGVDEAVEELGDEIEDAGDEIEDEIDDNT